MTGRHSGAPGHESGLDPAQLIADLEEKLAVQTQEAQQSFERLQRATADFENSKRRNQQETADRIRYAQEDLLLRLLPVLDNFHRAFDALGDEADRPWAEGIGLVQRQFEDVLQGAGLEPIEALGQPFDPGVHEAIARSEAEPGVDSDVVVEELQRGYRLRGRVLRPALVKISG